jgi:uncharacterized phage protein gp47/JayE
MSFTRPPLATLVERAEADIETRLPGADARLRRSNLNVLARVHAGAVHGLYGYLEWLARQIILDTADDEFLERHASVWGIVRKPATPAVGAVEVTGNEGAAIPVGSTLVRPDGVQYLTESEAWIVDGSATIYLSAVLPGQAGNAAPGGQLSFDTPINGIQARTTIGPDGMTLGTDIEPDADLRARLLLRIQEPPHGGAAHDYIAWALSVPGVTRAWVYPNELGLGRVTVRFVRDNDLSLIPDTAEVQAVQDYIDTVRPVTARTTVVAPVPVPLNFVIDIAPDTPGVRLAVEEELRDLIRRESAPGVMILLSHINEAISLAGGEHDHYLLSPTANIPHAAGEMAVFGSITWQ